MTHRTKNYDRRLERVYRWRNLRRVRCSTPGCPGRTQTANPKCSRCRAGRKHHLEAA